MSNGNPLPNAERIVRQPALAVTAKRCACGTRAKIECDEEWGPNCDLGNSPAHVKVASAEVEADVDKALGITRDPKTGQPTALQCALAIARQAALNLSGTHTYLPKTEAEAATWQPHAWVLHAIVTTLEASAALRVAVTLSKEQIAELARDPYYVISGGGIHAARAEAFVNDLQRAVWAANNLTPPTALEAPHPHQPIVPGSFEGLAALLQGVPDKTAS